MKRQSRREYRATWGDIGTTGLKLRVETISHQNKVSDEAKFFMASTAFLVAFTLSMLSAYGIHASPATQEAPTQIVVSQLIQP